MYKELFKKIINQNFDFSEDELKVFNKLIENEVLIKINDTIEINSKYKIGTIKVEKNFVILEDISNEHKNIKLDFDSLNGAYEGDLVIAKKVFNPRSKVKAKIIEVFSDTNKKTEALVYVKDKALYTVKESILLHCKDTKNLKKIMFI